MPRTYKPKNRYCRNTKLSEDEFAEALEKFLSGIGAAALARHNGRSERAMRTLYDRFRARLMSDAVLTGWMGGGDKLPPDDDPVWPAIYDCLVKCPAYVDEQSFASPEFTQRMRGQDPDGDHRQKTLTTIRKTQGAKCQKCPINLDFDFDYSVRDAIARHSLRSGGISRKNFKPHFFEIMLRANLEVDSTKFPAAREMLNTEAMLARFEQEPL